MKRITFDTHLLSVILFTPLAGALLLLFVNRRSVNTIRWIANLVTVARVPRVGAALVLYDATIGVAVRRTGGMDSVHRCPATYLGVDGFSCLLVLLTT